MNKGVKLVFLAWFFTLFVISIASAQTQVEYFHGIGCPHCAVVQDSGVLEKVKNLSGVNMTQYEVYYDAKAQEHFVQIQNFLNVKSNEKGIPFMMINCSGKYIYLVGASPIIQNAENYAKACNFSGVVVNNNTAQNNMNNHNPNNENVTLFAVILGGLADAFNPCALGVLAFLMISLLKIGSAKRALRAGIIYSFVVFLVYIFAGLGIFRAIQSFTFIAKDIYLIMGIIVLIIGGLQLIDTFFPDKFVSLRIPKGSKPMIERIAQKGTIPAIITLGAIVALFELPCTGGIYLGILTMISKSTANGILYLILYNLLFILPLLIITFLIYKGMSPKLIEAWSQGEKKWMKLVSGIVMLLIGYYLVWKI